MIRWPTNWVRAAWHRAGIVRTYWPTILLLVIFLVTVFWSIKDAADRTLLLTTLFSLGTALFAFFAYLHTRERFRLDLFDKRYALYESVVVFCSEITSHGSLHSRNEEERAAVERAIKAAHESFRGIGFHKARALFGEDIHDLFDKLNKSYSWLSAYGRGPGQLSQAEWAQKMHDETMFIWNTVRTLPEIFRRYMYFGDYKRDWI